MKIKKIKKKVGFLQSQKKRKIIKKNKLILETNTCTYTFKCK